MTFNMTTEELSSLVKEDKNLPQRLLNYTTYVQEFGLLNLILYDFDVMISVDKLTKSFGDVISTSNG